MNQTNQAPMALKIIGTGRLGRSIASSDGLASDPAVKVELLGRDFLDCVMAGSVLLLCVPDDQIPVVCEELRHSGGLPGWIGHTSGATSLAPLSDCHSGGGCFSLHPLQTVANPSTDLRGCGAAIAGSNAEALEKANLLASALGMKAFQVDEADRALYHAAASMASNFLVALEETAANILSGIEVDDPHRMLAPLVLRSVENWSENGSAALTGPILRGDLATVEAHRQALSSSHPELLDFYDSLADRTSSIAAAAKGSGAPS